MGSGELSAAVGLIIIVTLVIILLVWRRPPASMFLLWRNSADPLYRPPAPADPAPQGGRPPPILVRIYRARQQSDAVTQFQNDVAFLAKWGYRPISQSWAQGQWGAGTFLVALLLAVVLIGLLIFAYMLIVKPDGTLTVTYELADAAAPRRPEPPASASVRERLAYLDDLHTSGVISDEEYAAKRAKILDAL
jgi:hypothetical protein